MKIKSQKGAITIYVLAAMLVATALLVGKFVSSANKQQTQLEAIEQLKSLYGGDLTSEEIQKEAQEAYQKYIGGDIIPIYTEAQLQKIGSGEDITINGKIYTFSKTGKTYVLENDINVSGDCSIILEWIRNGEIIFEGQDYSLIVTIERNRTFLFRK